MDRIQTTVLANDLFRRVSPACGGGHTHFRKISPNLFDFGYNRYTLIPNSIKTFIKHFGVPIHIGTDDLLGDNNTVAVNEHCHGDRH